MSTRPEDIPPNLQPLPGQAPSVGQPPRWPLATQPGFRSTSFSPVTDACLINAYAELDESRREYWVEKRPGLAKLVSLGSSSPGMGLTTFLYNGTTYILTIFGGNLYTSAQPGGALVQANYAGSGHAMAAVGDCATFLSDSIPGAATLITFDTTVTAGEIVDSPDTATGYVNGQIGSVTESNITGSVDVNEISDLYTPDEGNQHTTSLTVSGFGANPGQNWLYSITFNGVTLFASDSSYGFVVTSENLAEWEWTAAQGAPLGFVDDGVYPGTIVYYGPPGVGSTTVFWVVGGGLFLLQESGGTFTYENMLDVSDSGFTTNLLCDGLVYLDGTLYVMDTSGNIWGSDIDDPTTWVGTNVIEAGGRLDTPICLVQQLEYVIALKSTSTRCFYDAGSATGSSSPLAWIEGADSNFGCASGGSVQLIDETLVWLSNNLQSTLQVVRMDNLQVRVVSTAPVERLLQDSGGIGKLGQVYSSVIKRGGHRFYLLTMEGFGLTLAYDIDMAMWYLWTTSGADPTKPWEVACTGPTVGTTPGQIAQDASSGAIYYLDIDQVYPTDVGTPCQVDIYTPNWDAGTRRRKQLQAMFFVADQVSGSVMTSRYSNDDYTTWSSPQQVRLDVRRPMLTRQGTFTRRAYNFRHLCPTPMRIKAGELQMDKGVL